MKLETYNATEPVAATALYVIKERLDAAQHSLRANQKDLSSANKRHDAEPNDERLYERVQGCQAAANVSEKHVSDLETLAQHLLAVVDKLEGYKSKISEYERNAALWSYKAMFSANAVHDRLGARPDEPAPSYGRRRGPSSWSAGSGAYGGRRPYDREWRRQPHRGHQRNQPVSNSIMRSYKSVDKSGTSSSSASGRNRSRAYPTDMSPIRSADGGGEEKPTPDEEAERALLEAANEPEVYP